MILALLEYRFFFVAKLCGLFSYFRNASAVRGIGDHCWPTTYRGMYIHVYPSQERRKEIIYLTTHSTHFIFRLYGVRLMVKDHSDSEKGNLLLPHGLLFPISSKGSFIIYMHHSTDRITHHSLFYTSRGALAGYPSQIKTNKGLKIMLFNKTRLYNMHIFYKYIIFKYRTSQIKATETNT